MAYASASKSAAGLDKEIASSVKDVNEADGSGSVSPSQLQVSPTHGEEPNPHSKPCDLCQRRRDVLIRCQTDETRQWRFICTGKCWTQVSGGEVDGDGQRYPFYKYGGMWRNKHEVASAKIKGEAKARNRPANGAQGIHRGSGHWTSKAKKLTGDVVIGPDDGGSDIEVSDLSDGVEVRSKKGEEIASHIQVLKRGD